MLCLPDFPADERLRIGIHTCPGGDRDSTHSADVDYADLLPALFQLDAGNFYVALAGEKDRARVLEIIRNSMRPGQRVFVGVVAPIDPRIETPEEVRDRVLEAARYIPVGQLGTIDDCGFAPFSDDTSTSRDTAFAKIRARVEGTAMAAAMIGRGERCRATRTSSSSRRHCRTPPAWWQRAVAPSTSAIAPAPKQRPRAQSS